MSHYFPSLFQKISARPWRLPALLWSWFVGYWQYSIWHKTVVILVSFCLLVVGTMYGIARWYIAAEAHKPLVLGTTFIPSYAESLGLEPKATMQAIIDELGVRRFRLVSYWNEMERTPSTYDFSQLDWQFKKAEAAHATVSLSLGLRQPRWPECHMPEWAAGVPATQWQPQLEKFMTAVIRRYKNSPSLESYQLENEFFNHFGQCYNFDRRRLIDEFNLVKRLDSSRPVIVSRSNNYAGLPLGKPTPDVFGVSVYRRVWDAQVTHRYLQYPFPAWYYGFLAGAQKLMTGKDSIIHELQTEAWPPAGKNLTDISLDEQNKTLTPQRMAGTVAFAKATGLRTIDLWGSEYWYYRKVKLQDPSLWDVARQTFHQAMDQN